MLRRLVLALLAVVVVGGLLGDRVGKGEAEARLASSVRDEVTGIGAADAEISSFPFLGRLLVQGRVPKVVLTLRDVVGHVVPVHELRLEVDGLQVDRDGLLGGEAVEVTGIDRATVVLRVEAADLRALLGPAGPLVDAAFAAAQGATLAVVDGRVQVGEQVSFPLPGSELLPCDPAATVEATAVVITCSSDHLPDVVVDAIGSAALRAR